MSQSFEEQQYSKSLINSESEGETKEADGGTVNGRPRSSPVHSEEEADAFMYAPDKSYELKEDHFPDHGGFLYDLDIGGTSSGETKSKDTSTGETKSEDTSTEAPKKDKKSMWQQVQESVVGKPKKPVPPPFKA